MNEWKKTNEICIKLQPSVFSLSLLFDVNKCALGAIAAERRVCFLQFNKLH